MKSIKRSFICIIVLLFLILTGCGILPSPSSLISPPKYAKNGQDPSYATEALVRQSLPEGTTLYIPENPAGAEAIRRMDMDHDGSEEIMATYKFTDKSKGIGCIILKQQDDDYYKFFDELFLVDKLQWATLEDFAGDNRLELLIGMGLSDYYSCRIYSFDEQPEIIYKGDYSFLKMLDVPDNDQKTIAMLTRKDNTYADKQHIYGYYGKLMRWERDGFAMDMKAYEEYYDLLEPMYRQELEKSRDSVIANYYFAEWMVNCNRPEEALELIETIQKDESYQYKNYVIKTGILEGQALSELGRYDEAEQKIMELIHGIEDRQYAFMGYKLPYLYLILGRNYKASGQPEKAREAFEKSIETNDDFLLDRYEENRFWNRIAKDELSKIQ